MNILDNRFDYSYAVSHRLEIPNKYITIKSKKIRIELLVTNGFVKLYTYKGRLYNIFQNNDEHTIPDWKFHFNVKREHIPKSFNIISQTLLEHIIKNTEEKDIIDDLIISMKAYNINLCTEMQAGREITLYIYTFDERLNESPFELDDKDEEGKIKKIKYIFTKNEEKKFKFYYDLLIDIEKKLEAENINQTVKNGCAYGDLWIGKYASLRNEAYCKGENGGLVYPPNEKGWNSTKQKMPFSWIDIFRMRYVLVYKKNSFYFVFFSLIILIISILIYFLYLGKFYY